MSQQHPISCRSKRIPRHGIATLELVMSLPFLLVVIASVVAVGWASLHKSGVAVAARDKAWQMRLAPGKTASDAAQPLAVLPSPTSGAVYHEEAGKFGLPSWMGGTAKATSRNTVLAGSWDYREVNGFDGDMPHFGILGKMVDASALGAGGAANLGSLSSIKNLVELAMADAVNGAANAERERKANDEQYANKRKEAQTQLDAWRKKRAELQTQRNALQSQVSAKRARQQQLQSEINSLLHPKPVRVGGKLVTPPIDYAAVRAKQRELSQLQSEIQALNAKIRDLDAQIKKLDEQIAAVQGGLNKIDDFLKQFPK